MSIPDGRSLSSNRPSVVCLFSSAYLLANNEREIREGDETRLLTLRLRPVSKSFSGPICDRAAGKGKPKTCKSPLSPKPEIPHIANRLLRGVRFSYILIEKPRLKTAKFRTWKIN